MKISSLPISPTPLRSARAPSIGAGQTLSEVAEDGRLRVVPLPPRLTDTTIRTEFPCPENRAAQSAAIETEEDRRIAPQPAWLDCDSLSDRVRALLLPHSLETVLADYFERKWLFIERGNIRRPHEGLYSLAALLDDLRRQRVPADALMFVARNASNDSVEIPRARFLLGSADRPRAETGPLAVHFERIAEYVDNRTGSLVVHRVEQFVPQIFELASELAEALRASVQVTAYYTPRDSRTFDLHWDTHDVIILQLEGQKHWQVYETLVPLPLARRDYMASSSFEGYDKALDSRALALSPGDLLYLPRGVPHVAWTEDSPSLHLTVGLVQPTWMDVLEAAVSEALQTCEKKLSFRHGCLAVFPRISDEELQQTFHELVGVLTQRILGAEPRRLAARTICRPPLLFRGHREVVLDTTSFVDRVACVHSRGHDDGGSWLEFHGKIVRFPPNAASAVEFVATHRRFPVHDIPGLSGEEQLVLAQRLLREGFLWPTPEAMERRDTSL